MAHTLTATVDGFAGAGVVLAAAVLDNISKFEVNVDEKMLKLTDVNGKVTDVAISDVATFTVTIGSFYVTAITVAN